MYAKAFRDGQIAGSPEEAAVKTKNMAAAVARILQGITRVNTAIAVTAGVIFLLFIIVMFSFSSCGAMFADTFTMAMAGTYLSGPAEIDAAELYFTQMEMDLQERIENIPDDYPGYDEYSYNLGEIRHDPFTLISYLSAVYTEFTAGNVAGETASLFNSMYNLELEPVTETRTKVEIFTVTDPVTGQGQLHRGIDISVPEGTEVYATHNGTVSASGYNSIYGSYIVITDSNGFTTKYACLGSIYVSAGQEIADGTQIGTSGTAGESTESHLHLEMMYNGVYYNPVFYFGSMA